MVSCFSRLDSRACSTRCLLRQFLSIALDASRDRQRFSTARLFIAEMKWCKHCSVLLLACLVILRGLDAASVSILTTTASPASWTVATNWQGGVPASGAFTFVQKAVQLNVPSGTNPTVGNLTLANAQIATAGGSFTVSGPTLWQSGNFSMPSSGSFSTSAAVTVAGSGITHFFNGGSLAGSPQVNFRSNYSFARSACASVA